MNKEIKCKFCEMGKAGLAKKSLQSESGREIAFIDQQGCFITYTIDDYDSRRAFKIGYCPMCGRDLKLNAECPKCNRPFEKKRKDQKCCSKRCGDALRQQKRFKKKKDEAA